MTADQLANIDGEPDPSDPDLCTAGLAAVECATGVPRSCILLFDHLGVPRFTAWRGLSETFRMGVEGYLPWPAGATDPEPVLVPDVALDPALAELGPVFDAEPIAALAFIPLVHAGRLLGTLMLCYPSSGPLPEHEIRVASTIARLVAGLCAGVARLRAGETERARLLAAQRAAQVEAESSAARLDALQRVTAGLSRAVELDDVVGVVLGTAVRELGGYTGSLCLRDGDDVVIAHTVGYPREVIEHWGRFPVSADLPASEAVRTARAVFIESPEERDRRYPVFATSPVVPDEAYAIVPLADHDPSGCLVVGFPHPRKFSAQDEDFFFVLASRCGAALDRARLFEEREQARATAEASRAALAFLAEASALLASSLDYERTLTRLAELAVPRLADWCGVYLTGEAGEIAPVAITHVDPQRAGLVRQLLERFAARTGDAACIWDVIRTGQPQRYPEISDDVLAAVARDHEHLELLRSVGLGAAMVMPLKARERVLGAFLLGNDRGRALSPDDALLAEELAARAGTAIDNARLFADRTYVAQTLQRSLLPGQLPEFDRLALAARYLPGAPEVAAGGDWYDVLALDPHRVAIVVGDVVGRGAAAAAVMGQLRTALATALLYGDSAAAALEHLDRVAVSIPGAAASTVVVLILDLDSGQLCWSLAGHPPPLLIEPADARYLADAVGSPLGIPGRPPYPESTTRIEAGACLLLYTDGLIERRGQAIDEGLDHLAFTAAQLRDQPPATLLDGVLARALPETGPADDIALIAARYLPAPLHQRLRADPRQLSVMRRAVRDWIRAGALPAALSEDLHITLGEAATNAVEHAYGHTGEAGDFTYRLTRHGDGAIEVEVRDFGSWHPPPPANHYRGRGLIILREIGVDVVVDPGATGTLVRFRLPAAPAEPAAQPPAPIGQAQPDTSPPVAAELHVHQQPDCGRRLELRGELDLDSAARLREPLLDQLHDPGPVTLDLRSVTYLSSAGVGLLVQATAQAARHHTPLRLQLTPDSLVARVLALTGLAHTMPMVNDITAS